MRQSSKLNGCLKLIQQLNEFVIVAWLSNTQDEFIQSLNDQHGLAVDIELARTVSLVKDSQKILILLEHYPLRSREENLIISLNPKQAYVLSSLDEPLFEQFGGDRIIQLMKSLGLNEDEVIEHPIISKPIEQIQQKIEKRVSFENQANSSKDRFERNISIV